MKRPKPIWMILYPNGDFCMGGHTRKRAKMFHTSGEGRIVKYVPVLPRPKRRKGARK